MTYEIALEFHSQFVAVICGYDTWFAVRLVMDLYSEIDQIHLSSEPQCVSHHLLLVDCHTIHNCIYLDDLGSFIYGIVYGKSHVFFFFFFFWSV